MYILPLLCFKSRKKYKKITIKKDGKLYYFIYLVTIAGPIWYNIINTTTKKITVIGNDFKIIAFLAIAFIIKATRKHIKTDITTFQHNCLLVNPYQFHLIVIPPLLFLFSILILRYFTLLHI
ncbi:MAG: hypothetical protein P1P85_00565 [Patescibacteria group bacterium]|nr:hypothetical protein [Patescibacteria group bacterium]